MPNFLASPWIPAVVFVLLACGARLFSESWLAPSAFVGLVWSVYLMIPLLIAPEFLTPSLGVWVLLSLVMSIQVGAWLTAGEARRKQGIRLVATLDSLLLRKMEKAIIVSVVVAVLGAVYLGWKTVQENDLSLSGAGLLAIGSLLSVARYSGENEPFIFRFLYMWVYPAALLGGIAFAFADSRKSKLICFAAAIPALVYVFVETAKAGLLFVVCCWLAGYLAIRVVTGREHFRLLSRKILIAGAICVFAGLSLFVLTDAIRSRSEDQGVVLAPDSARMKAAMFGYLSAFSQWMSGSRSEGLGFGAYTLGGLFDLAGLHPRAIGVYTSSVTLPGLEENNVYTAFRGLIEDFSFPGAIVICFGFGALCGYGYEQLRRGRLRWALGVSAFYAFVGWSPLGSLFVYNGLILAWCVAGVVLLGGRRRAVERKTISLNLVREV
ncbi:MAG: O-antigen polymerase [Candidatus Acidiferrales bacterium]